MFVSVYLGVNGITLNMGYEFQLHIGPPVILALIFGIVYGFLTGNLYYFLEDRMFKGRSLWQVIVYQGIVSLGVMIILFILTRHFLLNPLERFFLGSNNLSVSNSGWPYMLVLLLVYTSAMTILISFINQMNKKFGPGVLIPMLLGRFREPREDDRVFMFLDLKNSTTIAERTRACQVLSTCQGLLPGFE